MLMCLTIVKYAIYFYKTQVLLLQKILWYEYHKITYYLPIFNGESVKL